MTSPTGDNGAPFDRQSQALLERGKAKKVALVAYMRKLLVTLNAILRDSSHWNSNYQVDF